MTQYIAKGASYSDDKVCIQAFGSTDVGVSWYIETEGKRLFHAGDLNNWHWVEECTKEESMQYEKAYLGELKDILKSATLYKNFFSIIKNRFD